MRKILILSLACILCGCAYTADEIKTFMSDPHYAGYQEDLDNLEHSYLQKEISYPEYLKRKERIEDTYTKEVQERESVIHQVPNE